MSQFQDSPVPHSAPGGGKAIASVVLGVIALIAWCLPIIGFPLSMVGIILGALDLKSPNRNIAVVGMVLNGLGLLASILNGIAGVLLVLHR